MKKYQLKRDFKGVKKGTGFYLVVESEYIGIKEYVVRTQDFTRRMIISEREMEKYFIRLT
ncbi:MULTISPECIES: hypothetical protein [Bacillaceae]|uniref:hypothetical protein n=1 Tax=Bacillaceae TaxID=186817 RepID=UPI001C55CE62|nr:hypothetical protein [Rossellomorea sp. YZS02]MBW3112372.1 hypothetical protein [Bacillus sp. MCCB 382]MDX8342499.1 hypothetical protein [Rossellomorea sp. YZS02]